MIRSCTCNNPNQDKMYGPGMRMHNVVTHSGYSEARCTVCGNKVKLNETPKKEK